MPKLFLHTFGCQMNEHDSLKIASYMKREGYELTGDIGHADCIILNTCSIRQKPEQKIYSALGRLRALKQKRPSLLIGVGGCVAQREGQRLLERMPHVDFVFGTHQIHRVPEIVSGVKASKRVCRVDFSRDVQSLHHVADPPEGEVKAYLTVMQGCGNFCAYCIVPYVRGREQSRSPGEILAEAARLADRGVREITLLGQNVNSYGRDLPGSTDFPGLLERLNEVEGIERIRFTTSHPKDLSERLADAIAGIPKVCEHLHLPVQSGSSRILGRMNRGYNREQYLQKIRMLREKVPGISLTTDIIVGFPGETRRDFEDTLSLLEEIRYDGIYSFKFSPRAGTAAASMTDDVSAEEKAERLARLQAFQRDITASLLGENVGRREEILVEGPSPKGEERMMGRTRRHRIVHVPRDPRARRGEIVAVQIERALKNSLVGRVAPDGGGAQ